MSTQPPQRQGEQAPFDPMGWGLNEKDMESVFRFLSRFVKNPGDLELFFKKITTQDLEINGEISGTSVVTTITDPGSDTKIASEQAIRELHESGVIASGKASWAEFFVLSGVV